MTSEAEAWTPASTQIAWRLAGAHGHQWASEQICPITRLSSPACAVFRGDGSLDPVATSQAQAEYAAWHGAGLSPSLGHRTSTGRLCWLVDSDGAVMLTVARRSGRVLEGCLVGSAAHRSWARASIDVRVDLEHVETRDVRVLLGVVLAAAGIRSLADCVDAGGVLPEVTALGVAFEWPTDGIRGTRGATEREHCVGLALNDAIIGWLDHLDQGSLS